MSRPRGHPWACPQPRTPRQPPGPSAPAPATPRQGRSPAPPGPAWPSRKPPEPGPPRGQGPGPASARAGEAPDGHVTRLTPSLRDWPYPVRSYQPRAFRTLVFWHQVLTLKTVLVRQPFPGSDKHFDAAPQLFQVYSVLRLHQRKKLRLALLWTKKTGKQATAALIPFLCKAYSRRQKDLGSQRDFFKKKWYQN